MYTGAVTMKSYLIVFLSFAVAVFSGVTTRQPLKETPFHFTIGEGEGQGLLTFVQKFQFQLLSKKGHFI